MKTDAVIRKMILLNPTADIGVSSKTTDVIWTDVPASQLVLPPGAEYGGEIEHYGKILVGHHTIVVKPYGE